jgi:hypothetical protein
MSGIDLERLLWTLLIHLRGGRKGLEESAHSKTLLRCSKATAPNPELPARSRLRRTRASAHSRLALCAFRAVLPPHHLHPLRGTLKALPQKSLRNPPIPKRKCSLSGSVAPDAGQGGCVLLLLLLLLLLSLLSYSYSHPSHPF